VSAHSRAPKTPAAPAGISELFGPWFVGFMVIGGEWFLMWQSSTWNGQEAAFRFYLTVLAVSAYVLLDTGEG
jgi:predicted small integral membrane protein